MFHLKSSSVEWARKHLGRFNGSDFFPRPFEYAAIDHDWDAIKAHLLRLDLHSYVPQTPVISLALKPNGTFRVVH